MILRFRDLSTPIGDTIRLHEEKIQENGYAWWGWWALPEEPIPREVFAGFVDAINSGQDLTAHLVDSGRKLLYKAVITKIEIPIGSAPMDTPEPDKTPNYYLSKSCKAWFKLTSIKECNVSELSGFSYEEIAGFLEDPTSKVFANKRIFGIDEMLGRRPSRTIYFAQPFDGVQHKQHEILLVAPRQPAVFSIEPRFRPSNYIIHLSDLHFGNSGFPRTDEEIKKSLTSLLIADLTELDRIRPAALVISGDHTWQGKPEEFQQALGLITALRSRCELDPFLDVLIIPGNHDITWAEQSTQTCDTASVPTLPGQHSGEEAEKNYRDFFTRTVGIPPNKYLSIGRRYVLQNYVTIDLIGLNSCRLETRNFQGYGFVGLEQMKEAADVMGWSQEKNRVDYRLAFLHHHLVPVNPVEEVAMSRHDFSLTLDAGQLLYKMEQFGVDAACHGHQHQPFLTSISKPTKTGAVYEPSAPITIHGAGSVGVDREKLGTIGKNSYSIYEFDRDSVTLTIRSTSDDFAGFETWSTAKLLRIENHGLTVSQVNDQK